MADKMAGLIRILFSQKWTSLHDGLGSLSNATCPGVYLLAYSKGLQGQSIAFEDIFYVGMSHSRGGVQARLKQFLAGIENGRVHSGAMRFQKEFGKGIPFSRMRNRKTFYLASVPIDCNVDKATRTAKDLRKMGDVAALEYYVLA